jgi:pSer/pThr/pTyr-binding forkhead associated (FHA) protein
VATFRLIVLAEGGEEHPIDLDQDVVLVGRRPGLDVVLPHAEVGGVHARLERRGRELFLVDAGAAKTELCGARVSAGSRRALADGDEIVFAGRVRVRVCLASPEGAAPTSRAETAELARRMAQQALAALGKAEPERTPFVEVVAGPGKGRRLPLVAPGQDFVVGRGESCDLAIVDADLSREHLRLRRTWGGTLVADLGSKNGTLLDERPLPSGEDISLKSGDTLVAGGTEIRFVDPVETYLAALEPRPKARLSAVGWIGLGACVLAVAGVIWLFVL